MLFPLPATLYHKQEQAAIQGFWCFLSLFLSMLSWTHTWGTCLSTPGPLLSERIHLTHIPWR